MVALQSPHPSIPGPRNDLSFLNKNEGSCLPVAKHVINVTPLREAKKKNVAFDDLHSDAVLPLEHASAWNGFLRVLGEITQKPSLLLSFFFLILLCACK